jgi:hypothetical protein
MNLEYASGDLKNDIEIVKIAIDNNPESFQFCSSKLRDNKDIVEMTMKKSLGCFDVLLYAGKKICKDKNFILDNLDFCHHFLFHINEKLFQDREFISKLIKRNPYLISRVDKSFLQDKNNNDIITNAIKDRPILILTANINITKKILYYGSNYKRIIGNDFSSRFKMKNVLLLSKLGLMNCKSIKEVHNLLQPYFGNELEIKYDIAEFDLNIHYNKNSKRKRDEEIIYPNKK